MSAKITVIIPARSGSKGIKGKNLRLLGGIPLVQWSMNVALELPIVDQIIVSTDSTDVVKVADKLGIPVNELRDSRLCGDTTSMNEVVAYEIERNKLEGIIVLLQPTSPFRTVELLSEALSVFQSNNCDSLVSVVKRSKGVFWTFKINEDTHFAESLFNPIPTRRQDMPDCYELNGSIYIATVESFSKNKGFFGSSTYGYIMNESWSLDIDTLEDLKNARKFALGWKERE